MGKISYDWDEKTGQAVCTIIDRGICMVQGRR